MKRRYLLILIIALMLIVTSIFVMTACELNQDDTQKTPGQNENDQPSNPDDSNSSEGHEHVFGEWALVISPTETTEGSIKRKCTKESCAYEETFVLPKIAEGNYVVTVISKPTCESKGKTMLTIKNEQIDYSFEIDVPKLDENSFDKDMDTKCTKGLNFVLMNDDTYEVVSYTGNEVDVFVPNYYNGKRVARIGNKAFVNNKNILNIIVAKNIFDIDKEAFLGCTNVNVLLRNNLGIDDFDFGYDVEWNNIWYNVGEFFIVDDLRYAFIDGRLCMVSQDKTLTSIRIPSKVKHNNKEYRSIFVSGFKNNCNLKEVVVDYGVEFLQPYAFYNCYNLEKMILPNSIINIKNNALKNCSKIQLFFESAINKWSQYYNNGGYADAVYNYNNVTSNSEYDYVVRDNSAYITQYKGTAKDVVVPEKIDNLTVKGIGNTFTWRSDLNSIALPSTLESIPSLAFIMCYNLKELSIHDNIDYVGFGIGANTNKLETINMNGINGDYYVKDNCLVEKCSNSLVLGCTNSIIPNGVKKIGAFAFEGSNITSVAIPDSVEFIDEAAFDSCTSLTSIIIPSSVTSIGGAAFNNCSALTIYSERTSKPNEWQNYWNMDNCPVVWYGCDGIDYTYTFDSNNGTSVESITSNGIVSISVIKPTREGYTFYGWYDNEACVGELVAPCYYKKGGATLYAKWTPNA